MAQRLGEIILIQYPEVTVELYQESQLEVGHIISLEDNTPIGIVHTIVAVCIDEGKSTQALGQENFTDAELQQQYPHLKNSTRRLAKIWLYDGVLNLGLNQGIYTITPDSSCYAEKNYWYCLDKISLSTLKKHLEWLETHISEFEIKKFIKDLSLTNKALAWQLFIDRFS